MDKLATGQVFTAEQAVKNGLVDKLGFIEDAVDRAIELARLDKNKVKVVRYKAEPSFSSLLLGGAVAQFHRPRPEVAVGHDDAAGVLPPSPGLPGLTQSTKLRRY